MERRTKLKLGIAASLLVIAAIYFTVMALLDPCKGHFAESKSSCWSDRDTKWLDECDSAQQGRSSYRNQSEEDAEFCEELNLRHRRCEDYAGERRAKCRRIRLYGWLANLIGPTATRKTKESRPSSTSGLSMSDLEDLLPGTPAESASAAIDWLVGVSYNPPYIYATPASPWFAQVMIPVVKESGEIKPTWCFQFRQGVATQKTLESLAARIETMSPHLSPAERMVEDKILGTCRYEFGSHLYIFEGYKLYMPAATLVASRGSSQGSLCTSGQLSEQVSAETITAILNADYESEM